MYCTSFPPFFDSKKIPRDDHFFIYLTLKNDFGIKLHNTPPIFLSWRKYFERKLRLVRLPVFCLFYENIPGWLEYSQNTQRVLPQCFLYGPYGVRYKFANNVLMSRMIYGMNLLTMFLCSVRCTLWDLGSKERVFLMICTMYGMRIRK